MGHVLVENRNGLIVATMATAADGYGERDAAMLMVYERWWRGERIATVAPDKRYDSRDSQLPSRTGAAASDEVAQPERF